MKFFIVCLLSTLLWAEPLSSIRATAQSRPSGYTEADTAFRKLSRNDRVRIQLLLAAAGYWNAVPNLDFSKRIFDAIRNFQKENGKTETGVLNDDELIQLERIAIRHFQIWGFRELSSLNTPVRIWVPYGLGLDVTRESSGHRFKSKSGNFYMSFDTFPSLELRSAYDLTLRSKTEKKHIIHWSLIRRDFFVIASSSPDGIDAYERYHSFGQGIVGFDIRWLASASQLEAARIATLVSSSLWAHFNRFPLTEPSQLLVARAPPPEASQTARVETATATTPQPPPPTQASKKAESSGTGFFISSSGQMLTNSHVVEGCTTVEVTTPDGGNRTARILGRDVANDVALIKVDMVSKDVGAIRTGIKLGEQVAAFGFPLSGLLSTSGNFTLGNVTSLAGLGSDSRFLQVSTPVQPGNSGGPLLDQYGNVAGIVTSKLNALKALVATGDLPQNINFALKIGTASAFLETQSISLNQGSMDKALTPVELAELGRKISAQITCRS